MISRAALMASALALGAVGGAVLGGCGSGGTQTVSVASAPAAATSDEGQSTPRTTSTTTSTSTAKAPAQTTSTGAQSAAEQGTSTTRTAPAPAFTKTSSESVQGSPSVQAAAAADVVAAHGYTPTDISEYHANQTLRVLIGTRSGSADGYDQRAFFFLGGRYLGTDASQPSASIHLVSQSDTEVTLAYALYRSHDALCCPSGGQATVHFQLNDGQLVPLEPIPPSSSATGLARQ
jgi:LppP/LprE lipoprotein